MKENHTTIRKLAAAFIKNNEPDRARFYLQKKKVQIKLAEMIETQFEIINPKIDMDYIYNGDFVAMETTFNEISDLYNKAPMFHPIPKTKKEILNSRLSSNTLKVYFQELLIDSDNNDELFSFRFYCEQTVKNYRSRALVSGKDL